MSALWGATATGTYAPLDADHLLAAMKEIQSKMRASQRPLDAIFTTPIGRNLLVDTFDHRLEELRDGSGFGMVPLGAIPIKTLPDVASCFAAVANLVKQGKRAAILTDDGRFIDGHDMLADVEASAVMSGPICVGTWS